MSKPKTKMTRLVEQEIERWGPMTFAQYTELALYHPAYGYYSQQIPRGRGGDYFTASQIPLFPQLVGEAIVHMMLSMESEQFSIIEVGAGFGELMEGVLSVIEEKKLMRGVKVWAVERSAKARDELWRRLSRFPKCRVISTLDEIEMVGGVEGVIFSNEFFDALPFHRLRFHASGWRELFVSANTDGLVEVERPVSSPVLLNGFAEEGHVFQEGQEITLRPMIPEIYAKWAEHLTRGFVLTLDYGFPRRELWSPEREDGSWLCYHRHQVNRRPLEQVGEQDITAHVDFSQLSRGGSAEGFAPLLFCSQGLFLAHAGRDAVERLMNEGGNRNSSLASALQQLMHPGAMGEKFQVMVQGRGVQLPLGFQSIPNRVKRV